MRSSQELFRVGLSGGVSGLISAKGTYINVYRLEFVDSAIQDSKGNKIDIVHYWTKNVESLFNEIKKETKRTVITWGILRDYLKKHYY